MSRLKSDPNFIPFKRYDYAAAARLHKERGLRDDELVCAACQSTVSRWKHGRVGGEYIKADPAKFVCNLCRYNRRARRSGREELAHLGKNRRVPSRTLRELELNLYRCPMCKDSKPSPEYELPGVVSVRADWCAACRKATQLKSGKPRHFVPWRERKAVVSALGGSCRVCGKVESEGDALHIDHCHETGFIRGLLCAAHNFALGALNDSEAELVALLQYLQDARSAQARLGNAGPEK